MAVEKSRKRIKGQVGKGSKKGINGKVFLEDDLSEVVPTLGDSVEKEKRLPKILVGIPGRHTQDAGVTFNYHNALVGQGKLFYYELLPLENFITDDARNFIAKKAFEGGHDFIFMMDDDMMFPHGTLASLLYSLIEARKGYNVPTVIGGVYNRRGGDYELLAYDFDEKKHAYNPKRVNLKEGLVKCDMVGTGCALMDTAVFTKIDYPWFQYSYWPTMKSEPEILELYLKYDLLLKIRDYQKGELSVNGYRIKHGYDQFKFVSMEKINYELTKIEKYIKEKGNLNHGIDRWGEDAVFFKKCRDADVPVYLDTNVVCHHITRVLVTQKDSDNIAILSTAGKEI